MIHSSFQLEKKSKPESTTGNDIGSTHESGSVISGKAKGREEAAEGSILGDNKTPAGATSSVALGEVDTDLTPAEGDKA